MMTTSHVNFPSIPSLQYSPSKSDPDTEAEQLENVPPVTQTPQSKRDRTQKGCKLKSSLCKNYLLFGSCPYGERCQFAHGPQQLRCNTISNTSYKTKPCYSYLNKGYCPYGHRCNFIHKPLSSSQGFPCTQKLQNFPEMTGMIRSSNIGSKLLLRLGLKQDQ